MKYTILYITILTASIILLFCTTKQNTTNTNSDIPIIRLSKSKCFGKCKEYNFSIFKNRKIVYKGLRNVENIGEFNSTIDMGQYDSINEIMQSNNFETFETTYLSGAKDLQTVEIEHNHHKVKFHKRRAPQELIIILNKLDEIIDKVDWNSLSVAPGGFDLSSNN